MQRSQFTFVCIYNSNAYRESVVVTAKVKPTKGAGLDVPLAHY